MEEWRARGAVHIVIHRHGSDNAMYVNNWLTEVDLNFIALAIKQLNLEKVAKQGTQPSISQKQIYSSLIPLSPLSEQRRIVAYLDEVQVKITSLKKRQEETTAELNHLEQAILDKAFRGEL